MSQPIICQMGTASGLRYPDGESPGFCDTCVVSCRAVSLNLPIANAWGVIVELRNSEKRRRHEPCVLDVISHSSCILLTQHLKCVA